MDLRLNGKNVFISGSTAGIGFACAKMLLKEGANVWINGRTNESVSRAIEKLQLFDYQGQVKGYSTDFLNQNEVESLLPKLSNIDILINNVGIYSSQSFFETTDGDWQRQIEVNIMSGVRLSRKLLPEMLKNDWGRILFISSECATIVPEDLIAYSTTKAAILAISRGLAQLTKGSNVTVNTIVPGSTRTEGAEQFLQNMAQQENKSVSQVEQEFFSQIRTSSIIQRFADVEEVASTIAFYASPLSSATNGAAIKVDGGSINGLL